MLCCFVAGTLFFAGSPTARAAADPTADAIKVITEMMQDTCKKQDPLLGALVADGKLDDGQLQLQGYVARAEQADALRKAADKILAAKADWKKLFPRGASAAGLKPWQSLVREIQRAFAENTRPNRQERYILRQTRLDAIAFDNGSGILNLEGACIFLGAAPPALRSGEAASTADAVKGDPGVVIVNTIQDLRSVKELHLKSINYAKIALLKGADHPVLALQKKLIVDQKLDEVLLRVQYDADGTLQVEGIVGEEKTLEAIDRFFKDQPASYPYFRPEKEPKAPRWSRSGTRTIAWPLRVSVLQGVLAEDDDPLLRQTRLDRIYFLYGEEGRLSLRFEGICLNEKVKAKGENALLRRLEKEADTRWPELKSALGAVLNFIGIVYAEQPRLTRLQEEIAADVLLDGVRIDDDAYFDKTGALRLRGLWLGRNQENELRKLVTRHLQERPGRLLARGLVLAKPDFRPSGTDTVLDGLRQWVAENRALEDTWIERLFFNGNARLELAGTVTSPESSRVRDQLVALLGAARIPGSPPDPSMKLLKQQPTGFADKLRSRLVPEEPQWDGVLIERGYYNPEGEYLVSGLLDDLRQEQALQGLLGRMQRDHEWQSLSGKGWNLKALRVVPLQPMLARLERVLPADATFDGIQLEQRAYHNPQKELVLTCNVVGSGLGSEPAKLVQKLLQTHPEWKARAAAGVVLQPRSVQIPNEEMAEQLYYKAIKDIRNGDHTSARGRLKAVLLHNPRDSAAWFLSALCNMDRQDEELAERDLLRMLELEEGYTGARIARTRFEKLENVQGMERDRVARLQGRVEVLRARGRPALSLAAASR
jgi:hypothetical protein